MLMKNLKSASIKNIVFLLVLSVLLGCMLHGSINQLTDILMPEMSVKISVEQSDHPGNEVWILNAEGSTNLFHECWDGQKNGAWEYRDAESYGYACDIIVVYGESVGSSISFSVPLTLNSYICFWSTPSSGIIRIETDTDEFFQDLCSDTYGTIKVFPFRNSMLPVLTKISIYIALFVLSFFVLLGIRHVFLNKTYSGRFLSMKVNLWHGLLIWGILYIWAVIQYRNGIPNFLEFGDQVYYWSLVGTNPSAWTAEALAQSTISFRGYWCNLLPVASQVLGDILHRDPVLIYFLFTSFAITWMSVYIIPQTYELLTEKAATIFQVITFLSIYLFFWNGTLTAVLVDMFGAVSFMSGVMFALKFWKTPSLRTGFCAGLFWGIACNFRTAYQYGIILLLIVVTAVCLYKKVQKNKPYEIGHKASALRKNVTGGVLLSLFAFLIVSIPQAKMNQVRGHIGILPYDYVGAWTLDGSPREMSLLETSANQSLSIGYTGYPCIVSDDQMLTMKAELYDREEVLTIPQILGVYLNSPIETLIYIGKKLFLAFDIKTNVTYPENINWRKSFGLLFSFFNYSVLFVSVYTLLFHKKVNPKEQVLFACFLAGLVLPQMFVHVEWRYFIFTYIFLYYLVSYHFIGEWYVCSENNGGAIKKYVPISFIVYIFLAFLISLTIYA